jgi:hypothetical protein
MKQQAARCKLQRAAFYQERLILCFFPLRGREYRGRAMLVPTAKPQNFCAEAFPVRSGTHVCVPYIPNRLRLR